MDTFASLGAGLSVALEPANLMFALIGVTLGTAVGYAIRHTQSTGLDASLNWWGTTDTSLIEQAIYDVFDNPGIGLVSPVTTGLLLRSLL